MSLKIEGLQNHISATQSYLDLLRSKVGAQKLIAVAVRAILLDTGRRILLIRRRDNLNWSLPSGGLEVGESIYDCLLREVKEETGLDVLSAIPIALYSQPRFSFKDNSGHDYQLFCVAFHITEWQGSLIFETSETVQAAFFSYDNLPVLPAHQLEAILDSKNYHGHLILK